jgi:hypothetical protein
MEQQRDGANPEIEREERVTRALAFVRDSTKCGARIGRDERASRSSRNS